MCGGRLKLPDISPAVYRGRKTSYQTKKQTTKKLTDTVKLLVVEIGNCFLISITVTAKLEFVTGRFGRYGVVSVVFVGGVSPSLAEVEVMISN